MSEDEEQNWGTSRKVEIEWSTRETVDVSDSIFYYNFAVSSRKGYNLSGI